jgi:pilus assembly protein CpaE
LAVVRSPELEKALKDMVGARPGTRLETVVGRLAETRTGLVGHLDAADVLLFDIDAQEESDLAALRQIVDAHGQRAIVMATASDVPPAAVRRLLRNGIADLLPQPLTEGDVLEAMDHAARKLRQREGEHPRGPVLAFMRAKGGVGATMLALHVALGLQMAKRKNEPRRTACVLDLDLQFGDAALCLDLEVKPESLEIVRAPERLDAALLRAAMVHHKSGLAVLPAPPQPVPLEAMTPEGAARMIALAREDFDYVILDLPLALTGWVDSVLHSVDHLVVVTGPSVPAIRRTRCLLDLLADESFDHVPVSVALNRYTWRFGEGERLKQRTNALGRPIDHLIPDDERLVLDAANRGVPIFELGKRSRVARAIEALAARCDRRLTAEAAIAQPPESR